MNLAASLAAALDPRGDWERIARPNQLPPPGDWRTWLVLAGRGWGKTRTGAEWVRAQVEQGTARRVALVGPTAADVRDVMVEGTSGILSISPNHARPIYEPSKRRLTWPNGAIATTFSADEPDRLRGPQHDCAWADELAAWRFPDAWDQLQLGLRLGADPRQIVTTTPRPVRLVRDLLNAPTTAVTRGSTGENAANLAPAFLDQIVKRYQGTRLGRQELDGELLEDVPGALWQRAMFDQRRSPPGLVRVVVGVDPAVSSGEESDETGIVVVGLGVDGAVYVLDDRSGRYTPDGWARQAIAALAAHGGDRIVAEANQGGAMVAAVLQTVNPYVPVTLVHASRGKLTRAEPVASLYEQRRAWHVRPLLELEDQLTTWTPASGSSPDRLDALVWAVTNILEGVERWELVEDPLFVAARAEIGIGTWDRGY